MKVETPEIYIEVTDMDFTFDGGFVHSVVLRPEDTREVTINGDINLHFPKSGLDVVIYSNKLIYVTERKRRMRVRPEDVAVEAIHEPTSQPN